MAHLVQELVLDSANQFPEKEALAYRQSRISYAELAKDIESAAQAMLASGLDRGERVAVYLEKRLETVTALFGATAAGGVFVPVNPLLKAEQVTYILRDCNVRILVTSPDRLKLLLPVLPQCHDLHTVMVVGSAEVLFHISGNINIMAWSVALGAGCGVRSHRSIDDDMAAILYTSGSTGKPKGVTHSHETYMKRAMELAKNGSGQVSPNPLVGCVIVHDGRIIGEGWHKKYGGPHAEVHAIDSVEDKQVLRESTLYVNLEPCSHTGKTPPCADMIISHKLSKVIIANRDNNPLVAGRGIKKLRDAGIAVITDILSNEGQELNARFFTYMEKQRPRIILKWAETSDGFIARKNNDSKWISDEYSRQLVHKWRSEEDAVLVASGTAWHDNPSLSVRDWTGRDPVRIVIDRYLKLGPNQNLFNGKQQSYD